ncbi:hypothetical protein F4814DRAFT_418676 [Daldinia grandis]|nr:hypothetical protein F4814DRAFT_418676 [Daldinia grandis]
MMWGEFPALIPAKDSEVEGMCWKCESPEHVGLLRRYETGAYRMEACDITTDEGEVIENGRIFVSTGLDLSEGRFDLKSYVRRHARF